MGKTRNFLKGVGSLLEIRPAPHSSRISLRTSSRSVSAGEAIAKDWQAVGNDIRTAMGKVSENGNIDGGK